MPTTVSVRRSVVVDISGQTSTLPYKTISDQDQSDSGSSESLNDDNGLKIDVPRLSSLESRLNFPSLKLSAAQQSASHPSYTSSNIRLVQPTCSYFRSGARFTGTQQSGRSTYQVQVSIQHVDFKEYFVSGLLEIQGLTLDNPSLTTYFEGEIIGPKYSFLTQRPDWGATERKDLEHWTKFAGFRMSGKSLRKADAMYRNPLSNQYIFMRWKEISIHHAGNGPSCDESVDMLSGASEAIPNRGILSSGESLEGVSFVGFYYICFHQSTGNILGMYYAENSEQFQQITLQPAKDGKFESFEFR